MVSGVPAAARTWRKGTHPYLCDVFDGDELKTYPLSYFAAANDLWCDQDRPEGQCTLYITHII